MKKYYDEQDDKNLLSKKNDPDVMIPFSSKANFLFYTTVHTIGAFAAQTVTYLFFTNVMDWMMFSGVVAMILIGTVIAVRRDKMKLLYALKSNLCFFFVWTMYFFALVSGLSTVLFNVQL